MSPRRTPRPGRRPQVEALEGRTLPSTSPVWTVTDPNAADTGDTIVVQRSPRNANVLWAEVDGTVVSTHRIDTLSDVQVYGGSGNDTISVNVGNRTSAFGVQVWGGLGDDTITGTNGNDQLYGGGGNDTIDGAGGNDQIRGAAGDDRLHGGAGADQLSGGVGDNTFYGDDPTDTVVSGTQASFLADNANPLNPVTSTDQLKAWIEQKAVADWSSWFGQPAGGPIWYGTTGTTPPPVAGGGSGSGGATGGSTGSTAPGGGVDNGGTNTQVAGVDEADIFKTDGRYLYTIDGNSLLVIDAQDPAQMSIVGQVTIPGASDGSVGAFYLTGDKAVVLSQRYDSGGIPFPLPLGVADPLAGAAAMPVWWGWFHPQTVVTTVDLTDPTNPTVTHESTLDGSLVDSRAVNGTVYTVIQNNLQLPTPQIVDDGTGQMVYESQDAYLTRLDATLDDTLPKYTTTDYTPGGTVTGGGSLVAGANVYLPESAGDQQFLSVAVFDPATDTPGPASVTTVAAASGQVFAAPDALYVAATDYSAPWRGDGGATTQLYKFALDGDSAPLDAVGAVNGTVLDQFSMDEANGYFRIATTDGWSTDATNAVYVLGDDGAGNLGVVGSVTDLGTAESIKSVRFVGDTGYVTTFHQVDPLFVLDMSNPAAPAVVGQLTIPGYSSYLQSVGDGLLIGLGRDVDPATNEVLGLKLSLFDVSDPANPRLVDTFTFSTDQWGGSSPAEWDHHALSWFPDAGVLALPVSGDWTDPGVLEVLHIAPDGITELGQIAHTTPVLRSLGIGTTLFSLSTDSVGANVLTAPSTLLGTVALPTPEPPPPGPIGGPGGPPMMM